jgi:peptidoglycan DL-endopeptidase CwlO
VATRRTAARRSVAILAAIVCSLTLAPALSQADPKPSIDEVERQVAALQDDAEAATEAFLAAQLEADKAQQQLDKLNAKVRRSEAALAELQKAVGGFAAAAYRSGGLDQSFSLLLADDPSVFLAQASDLDGIARRQSDVMHKVAVSSQQLAVDKQIAAQQAATLAGIRADLAVKKKAIDTKVAQAQNLLANLKAAERKRLLAKQAAARAASAAAAARAAASVRPSRDTRPTTSGGGGGGSVSSTPPSGRAAGAVRFALAQVGKRYQYAATGPYAYDCSGLTMAAYRSVGVYLPHQSGAQFGYGRRVSSGELQPGDLVFYYSPIHHVGIYIGGGRIVHAANPSSGVRIDPLYSMPFVGAVRP